MIRLSLVALLLIILVNSSTADILTVGPNSMYSKPSDAARDASNGDTIEIDASGDYRCDSGVVWRADNLKIVGVNGKPHIYHDSECGNIRGGKGLWNPRGTGLIVDNIEFSGAFVSDNNGAGIRFDGSGDVIVRNSYFHDSQNGILFTPLEENTDITNLTIEYTEFAYNGTEDGRAHNLYINHVNQLKFYFNYSHHSDTGHLFKSRAVKNDIRYNYFSDGDTGTSSYHIDVSQGGETYIIGNILYQNAASPNGNTGMISYGAETSVHGDNPNSVLEISYNTIVSEEIFSSSGLLIPSALRLYNNNGELVSASLSNNILVGFGEYLITNNGKDLATLDNNLNTNMSIFEGKKFGLTLAENGPAQGNGKGKSPEFQYSHPLNIVMRDQETPDIGAIQVSQKPTKPELSFSSTSNYVPFGQPVTLKWDSNGVHCDKTGDWSGRVSPVGETTIDRVFSSSEYSITCTTNGGDLTESISVVVDNSEELKDYPDLTVEELDNSSFNHLSSSDQSLQGVLKGLYSRDGKTALIYLDNKLYPIGGDHYGWFGNGQFAYDIESKTIEQIIPDTPLTSTDNINPNYDPNDTYGRSSVGFCSGLWSKGDELIVNAGIATKSTIAYEGSIFRHQSYMPCSNQTNDATAWSYNLDGTIDHHYLYNKDLLGTIEAEAFDVGGKILIGTNKGIFTYDKKELTKIDSTYPYFPGGFRDAATDKDIILWIGSGKAIIYDVNAGEDYQEDWTLTGDTRIINDSSVAMTYNDDLNMFVAFDGVSTLFYIDADKRSKSMHFISQEIPSIPEMSLSRPERSLTYSSDQSAYFLFVSARDNMLKINSIPKIQETEEIKETEVVPEISVNNYCRVFNIGGVISVDTNDCK